MAEKSFAGIGRKGYRRIACFKPPPREVGAFLLRMQEIFDTLVSLRAAKGSVAILFFRDYHVATPLTMTKVMSKKKIKIVVLMGGPSAEHEVSLHTGEQIVAHLNPERYEITPAVIAKNGRWMIGSAQANPELVSKKKSELHLPMIARTAALHDAAERGIDAVFIALHGTFGEDGTVQGLLDAMKIPYTGSGVRASALGMHKPLSSRIFHDAGFNVPAFRVVRKNELAKNKEKLIRNLVKELSLPLAVKPSDHGSSVGVTIVHQQHKLFPAMREAGNYSPEIMVQKFIAGRELTCGVIERGSAMVALPPVEIIPKAGAFYDYASKYADRGSEHLIPPPDMDKKTIKMIRDAARHAHRIIGCSGMSRTDFILGNDGTLHILEINTIPGMTATSLLPQSAVSIGINFSQLLDIIINAGLKKK